ncbi:hypothetical protein [Gorillibacterium sp. CAU 1737]|uniref:hypothetical protein n=1 Tax=Gorillibacterium sp. CAU 1737 TaxID=3140362 RepID=UPI003261A03C
MEKYEAIAKEIIANKYWHVGVRSLCVDETYAVGDDCRESYEWDFENDCSTFHTSGETADGTCVTRIDTEGFNFYFPEEEDAAALAANIAKAVELNSGYINGPQAIIAGSSSRTDGHFDDNEVRLINAHVIGLL